MKKESESLMKKYINYFIVTNIIFIDLVIVALFIRFFQFKSIYDVTEICISACSVGATIYLGVIANSQNKRLMELEENSRNISKSSCVVLEYSEAYKTTLSNEKHCYMNTKNNYLYFKIYNCGEAMLKKIIIFFGNDVFESHLALAKGHKKFVRIAIPDNFNINEKIKIRYESCYSVISYATFKLYKIDNNGNFSRKYYHYEGLEKEK